MLRLVTFTVAALLATAARAGDPGVAAAKAYILDTAGSTAEVKVGARGKLVLVIRPKDPAWHVHPQAPLKLRFEAPAALGLEKRELSRRDAVDPKAAEPRFEAPFVASAAGKAEAKASVDFFICSDTACVKQTRTVAIPVAVN
jgi:nucleoid-associated protein YgaU